MTREDIIRMAREAGIRDCTCNGEFGCLERFAAFVAAASEAKEREACAKVCDKYSATGEFNDFDRGWLACSKNAAVAIRARGQA